MRYEVKKEMKKFLSERIFENCVRAAFSRTGGIYKRCSMESKKKFKIILHKKIDNLARNRRLDHTVKIKKLIKRSENCILKNNKEGKPLLRYGIAQKLLNLYLKYYWIINSYSGKKYLVSPPHCPIDSEVLKLLKKNPRISENKKNSDALSYKWTKCDCQDHYKKVIEVIKSVVGKGKGAIAEWELVEWNKYNRRITPIRKKKRLRRRTGPKNTGSSCVQPPGPAGKRGKWA